MTASQHLRRRLSRMAAGAIAMITLAGTIAGPAIGQQAIQPRLLVNPPDLTQSPPPKPAEPMALRATTTDLTGKAPYKSAANLTSRLLSRFMSTLCARISA